MAKKLELQESDFVYVKALVSLLDSESLTFQNMGLDSLPHAISTGNWVKMLQKRMLMTPDELPAPKPSDGKPKKLSSKRAVK